MNGGQFRSPREQRSEWNSEIKCFCTLCLTEQNVHVHFIFASKVYQSLQIEICHIIWKNKQVFIFFLSDKIDQKRSRCTLYRSLILTLNPLSKIDLGHRRWSHDASGASRLGEAELSLCFRVVTGPEFSNRFSATGPVRSVQKTFQTGKKSVGFKRFFRPVKSGRLGTSFLIG